MPKTYTTLKPPLEWSLGHIQNLLNILSHRTETLDESERSAYERAQGYWEAHNAKE